MLHKFKLAINDNLQNPPFSAAELLVYGPIVGKTVLTVRPERIGLDQVSN